MSLVARLKSRGLTRMTSSLSVTWVVNNTTPDLDLDKSRNAYKRIVG